MARLGEFEFIERFLRPRAALGQPFYASPLALGIGDDAALLPPLAEGEQLAISTDMLVEGRHYLADTDPFCLGHKALAVNLSDLAAMGARPLGFTLSMALRRIDTAWIEPFLDGMLGLARQAGCPLIGGDTTGLPSDNAECMSVTVLGSVPVGRALRRDGMVEGDHVWVSGALGDPAYAVRRRMPDPRLDMPQPRLELGLALRGVAHAAIDVSDGLSAEMMHLLQSSSARNPESPPLQAILEWTALPLGAGLIKALEEGHLRDGEARVMAAAGGDDYELLFSAAPDSAVVVRELGQRLGVSMTCIGHIGRRPIGGDAIVWRDGSGRPVDAATTGEMKHGGFRHF